MTELEILQTDLEIHLKSLKDLEDDTGAYFFRREGFSVTPLMATYRHIIASIQTEIAQLTKKSRKKSL